jgi:predicted transcriptional regulator
MDAKQPSVDLLIAVAGLLSTLVIAAIFYIVYVILVLSGDIVAAAVIQWVAFINIVLAVFHFVPAFPLDGGQALRAIIWMVIGDRNQATRIASWMGWGTAWLVTVGGIVMMIITNQWFMGGAMLVAGWGLQRAATRSLYQVRMQTALHGVTVEEIMTREFPQTSREIHIDKLLRESLLLVGKQQLVVADQGEFQGVVTIDAIKALPRRRWNNTKVGETMTPPDSLLTAHPQQLAVTLLEQMNELQIGRVPVVMERKVVGVVIRDDINRLVEARSRLRI